MKTLLLLLLLSTPLTGYMEGDYIIYRRQVDGQESFYSNSALLVKFLGEYNTESPLIFDIDGSGVVDMMDLLMILSGYGESYQSGHLSDVQVNVQYSHGWDCLYPEAWACFVHPTLIDETSDTLNSFWVEYIYLDSVVKEWVYKVD